VQRVRHRPPYVDLRGEVADHLGPRPGDHGKQVRRRHGQPHERERPAPLLVRRPRIREVGERAGREVVPESVLTKPPSAELRPDQRDDQSLPPYDALDPILQAYVEEDRTAAEIVELGNDEAVVRRVTRLVDIAEYKRRQSPPGVRVTTKAFGRDRRMPITNGYR